MPAYPITGERPKTTRETAVNTTVVAVATTAATVIRRRSRLFQIYCGLRASVPVEATPSLRNRSRACMASFDLG